MVATGRSTSPRLQRVEIALEPFIGQPIVLDLRRVEFMDSAGLKVLLHQRSRIQGSGGDLRLVVGNGAVGRLLELHRCQRSLLHQRLDRIVGSRAGKGVHNRW